AAPADAPPADAAPAEPDAEPLAGDEPPADDAHDAPHDADADHEPAAETGALDSFGWNDERAPRRSSKLGGALLIAGIAALVVVALIVVINRDGGGDDTSTMSTTPSAPAAATRTTAGRGASAQDTVVLQQVNLTPPAGGDRPLGIAFLAIRDGRPTVAVQVQDMPVNGQDDVYALWLQATDGSAKFLGYFPGQVPATGKTSVSAPLPANTGRFAKVVLSRESISAGRTASTPREIVLEGTIRVNRTG
ncbi:hypothetical protein Q5424_22655, partial [Conexibacter sp. JD483]|uniref:anti-sigma factor domain-containing protein n=3 Tax=unclassified Conexibacter TaxID=2627773 RepID=UPI00287048CD